MALVVGTNSYISVADADTYFSDRLYATDWTGASADDKASALIMATTALDMRDYYGERASSTQSLKFPRSGLPLIDGVSYDSSSIPQPIKNATCEEALIKLTNNPTSIPSDAQYKRTKLGDMEVEYRDTATSSVFLRTLVNGYLKGFAKAMGGLIHG